jgi:hypothetical protein
MKYGISLVLGLGLLMSCQTKVKNETDPTAIAEKKLQVESAEMKEEALKAATPMYMGGKKLEKSRKTKTEPEKTGADKE